MVEVEVLAQKTNTESLESIVDSDIYLDHKGLLKPGEIPILVKAYVRVLRKENDRIVDDSNKIIQSLDDLISKKKGGEQLYLIMYRQIAINTAMAIINTEDYYNKMISEQEKLKNKKISGIESYIKEKGAKRELRKWLSVGIGSIFSYYFGKFVVEYLNIPKEYASDATAAAIFGLIGGISFLVNQYYVHEVHSISDKFNKRISKLKDTLRREKSHLYRRAIKLSEISYGYHIIGKKELKNAAERISKEISRADGTEEGVFRRVYNSFVGLFKG